MKDLPADAVHVWWADPAILVEDSRCVAMLAPSEVEQLAKFRFDHDRVLYLATRVMVRTTLSRYANVSPRAWRFASNEYGRPSIDASCGLKFNLSNTRGMIVCAIADDLEVGVDVEDATREAPLEVAMHYFAPIEVANLRARPPAQQPKRFFDYWTLKESYIKARGLGLTIPLDRFAIDLCDEGAADEPVSITIDPSCDDDGAWWQLVQHRPNDRHVIAVCARRRSLRSDLAITWHDYSHAMTERYSSSRNTSLLSTRYDTL